MPKICREAGTFGASVAVDAMQIAPTTSIRLKIGGTKNRIRRNSSTSSRSQENYSVLSMQVRCHCGVHLRRAGARSRAYFINGVIMSKIDPRLASRGCSWRCWGRVDISPFNTGGGRGEGTTRANTRAALADGIALFAANAALSETSSTSPLQL